MINRKTGSFTKTGIVGEKIIAVAAGMTEYLEKTREKRPEKYRRFKERRTDRRKTCIALKKNGGDGATTNRIITLELFQKKSCVSCQKVEKKAEVQWKRHRTTRRRRAQAMDESAST